MNCKDMEQLARDLVCGTVGKIYLLGPRETIKPAIRIQDSIPGPSEYEAIVQTTQQQH
jgi:hypothetical protein